MRKATWGVSRGVATLVAAVAVVLLAAVPAGTADMGAPQVSLSDLRCEQVGQDARLYEVSVRVESAAPQAQSVEIGFFFTEERTRRHNLIGIVTVILVDADDWVRPGIQWDTSGLNPGLYKLRAVVMDTPDVSVENWRDEEEKTYDYVAVLLPDAGLVWPPKDVRLVLTKDSTAGEEILCSMDWDRLDGYPTPTASLADVWNVGGQTITAGAGTSQLLVRGVVTLTGEDGVDSAPTTFDFGGTIDPAELAIPPGEAATTVAVKRVDLERFVRAAIELYVEQEKESGAVRLRLGDPIAIRTALEFRTSDIEGKSIAGSLQSFLAYMPASTDPALSGATVFSLYTDVEDFVFPRQTTCATSPDTAITPSLSVPPIPSLDTGLRWNTYVIAADDGGDKIYLLSRRGQYGGIYGSPFPVQARDDAGVPTGAPASILPRPAVGVGEDRSATRPVNRPVLFFCADDGFLRAFMDLGTSLSPQSPDGWTANAVRVPAGSNGALSPVAVLPRPSVDMYTIGQDATEFVIVGSAQGLYVYRVEFGATGGSALYRSYEGYNVSTAFAPFAVKSGAKRLVYFFARKEGETVSRLWSVDVSSLAAPASVVLLVGGDVPSTELTAARTADLGEDLTYLFFGTEGGRIYTVDTTSGAVGAAVADVRSLGSPIMGVRAVVSATATSYDVYANTSANQLFRLSANVTGGSLRYAQETPYSPPYSNEYLMGPLLEILPPNSEHPGMIFLSYAGGPLVALDLEDPDQLMLIDVWADVWSGGAVRPAELALTPFEFLGCADGRCGGFSALTVARSGGEDRRLLLQSANGAVYAFDLTASIRSASEAAGGTAPVSP